MGSYQIGRILGTLLSPFLMMLIIGTIYYFIKGRRIPFRQAVFNRWVVVVSVIWVLISLFGRSFSATEQDASHVYPQSDVRSFTTSCVDSAKERVASAVAERVCACTITEIQKAYTYGEFKKFGIEMMKNNTIPEDWKEILVSCSRPTSQ